MANAYAARARATPRPSVAELEEAGRYMDLQALAAGYDLGLRQWKEIWQAEGRTRDVAIFLQALVFLGFMFRFHAPNRPGVLAACSTEAGCLDAACRLPACKGNYVEGGMFYVIHDKTEASHGQRPPAPVHSELQQLLLHWLDWGRAVLLRDPASRSLFIMPSSGVGMNANQASAYVGVSLNLVLDTSEVQLTSNLVRPARLRIPCAAPERRRRSAAPSPAPRTRCRRRSSAVRARLLSLSAPARAVAERRPAQPSRWRRARAPTCCASRTTSTAWRARRRWATRCTASCCP